jgi:hypothetical protein
VIVPVTLAVAALLLSGCALAWTIRRIHIGNLDAKALADKIATPHPVSALDWPELHVREVIPEPDGIAKVLLLVEWPAYPERRSTLVMALGRGDQRSVPLLSQWCAAQASVAPTRQGAHLELRRRQSLERVRALLIAEDPAPAWSA